MNPTMCTEKPAIPEELARHIAVAEVLALRVMGLLDAIRVTYDAEDAESPIGPAACDYLITHARDLSADLRNRVVAALSYLDESQVADLDICERDIAADAFPRDVLQRAEERDAEHAAREPT